MVLFFPRYLKMPQRAHQCMTSNTRQATWRPSWNSMETLLRPEIFPMCFFGCSAQRQLQGWPTTVVQINKIHLPGISIFQSYKKDVESCMQGKPHTTVVTCTRRFVLPPFQRLHLDSAATPIAHSGTDFGQEHEVSAQKCVKHCLVYRRQGISCVSFTVVVLSLSHGLDLRQDFLLDRRASLSS